MIKLISNDNIFSEIMNALSTMIMFLFEIMKLCSKITFLIEMINLLDEIKIFIENDEFAAIKKERCIF